jgi:predicted metalloprotease
MLVMNGGDLGSITSGNTDIAVDDSQSYDGSSIPAEEHELADFVSIVLADTEVTWNGIFAEEGLGDYREPTLVLFSGAVDTSCGYAQSAVGPFYCPVDENVYIDLSFYRDLKDRFGAPGDFAQAYVIAHEVGHHVQNQLGTMDEVQRAQQQADSSAEANALSVMLELQADCLAGVWGYHAEQSRDVMESGDIEEGLNAASAIGDDRLTQGRVSPDSFTHGTSEQRAKWFKTGLESGDIDSCDTFQEMS